jgi:hypothetical protein
MAIIFGGTPFVIGTDDADQLNFFAGEGFGWLEGGAGNDIYNIDFLTSPNGVKIVGTGQAVIPTSVDTVRAAVPFSIRVEAPGVVAIALKFGPAEATAMITIGRRPSAPAPDPATEAGPATGTARSVASAEQHRTE